MLAWWLTVGLTGIIWDLTIAGDINMWSYRRTYRATWWLCPALLVVGAVGVAVVAPETQVRVGAILAALIGAAAFRHYARWPDPATVVTTKQKRQVTDLARRPRLAWTVAGAVVLCVAAGLGAPYSPEQL